MFQVRFNLLILSFNSVFLSYIDNMAAYSLSHQKFWYATLREAHSAPASINDVTVVRFANTDK